MAFISQDHSNNHLHIGQGEDKYDPGYDLKIKGERENRDYAMLLPSHYICAEICSRSVSTVHCSVYDAFLTNVVRVLTYN